ncbi:MAG TPA: hypothetical protein VKS82_11125 [Streptosporangiaceae bacterium]|nr:hypothetical protein [Streptosporangiaceae bacterium]
MTPPGPRGLFGDEGRRLLDEQQAHLFPPSVRPAFLRLLWAALAALAIGVAMVIIAIGGLS